MNWAPLLRTVPFAVAIAAIGFACSDKEDGDPPVATQTGISSSTLAASTTASPAGTVPTQGGSLVEPVNAGPVSQFVVLVQDLGIQNFNTDREATRTLTADDYAGTSAFAGPGEGKRLLGEWGFADGYTTGMLPPGGVEDILNSAYVVYQELVMFDSAAGARAAFAHLAGNVRANDSVQVIETATVGNESIASSAVGPVLGDSGINQVYHQVVFRRGNVVTRMLTVGAEPLMSIQTAIELAGFVDAKLLDEREHPEPTPTPAR